MNQVKRIFKTLSDADRVFRTGDVYFISLHPTTIANIYTIVVFDYQYQYRFEIKDATSFDFRMLRKSYVNVYYWSEEFADLARSW